MRKTRTVTISGEILSYAEGLVARGEYHDIDAAIEGELLKARARRSGKISPFQNELRQRLMIQPDQSSEMALTAEPFFGNDPALARILDDRS
ncbi:MULTISPECIES: hypothetical protein [Roseobacteraceae]|uniref:hypothetical protein n=1 Tax=Roseobacteraceae TaxID=2854170 RepID=UPI00080A9E0D|nr:MULTISPECIES: hypothetical protein [Roseobacteraceae]ANT62014.1 hypothetical protein AYJ57_16355 [Salipiger sp. CCB-MM3]MCA0998692.1 hypothetical protein [Alloyangia pacifica]NDV98841.1 hypothetical protein [Salipiger sp. PrR002]NDW55578.1 hypothetical protein [Salipiger sp. PrR004]